MTLGHNTYKYMNDTTFRWCYYMLYVILFGTIFSIKLDIQVSFFFFFFFFFFHLRLLHFLLRAKYWERERGREREILKVIIRKGERCFYTCCWVGKNGTIMGVDSQHMLQWEKEVGSNHLTQVSWIPNPNLILYVLISLFLN